MTDTMFTRTALTEAAETAGVTPDQARTILEAAGVKVQPEKPLPTEPGSVIIATEVHGVKGKWRMMLDRNGDWLTTKPIDGYYRHRPDHITTWTEARIVPVAAVTLTEDQVGEVWDKKSDPSVVWRVLTSRNRWVITATVNTFLAQYAAPAEGEPIDPKDVREGDRVRVELHDGDEATFTVTAVGAHALGSHSNAYDFDTIHSVRLLDREEA